MVFVKCKYVVGPTYYTENETFSARLRHIKVRQLTASLRLHTNLAECNNAINPVIIININQ